MMAFFELLALFVWAIEEYKNPIIKIVVNPTLYVILSILNEGDA
jgi:hypothetical protein